MKKTHARKCIHIAHTPLTHHFGELSVCVQALFSLQFQSDENIIKIYEAAATTKKWIKKTVILFFIWEFHL